jgi:hypothetical protein
VETRTNNLERVVPASEESELTQQSDSAGSEPSDTSTLSSDELRQMLDEASAAIAAEHGVRAWLRALPSVWRGALAALGVLAMLAAAIALIPRAGDFHYFPALRLWASIGVYSALLALLVRHALRPLHCAELSRRVVLTLGLFAFLLPYALALWPSVGANAGRAPNDCFPIGLGMGAALIVLLRALDRAELAEPRVVLLSAAAGGIAANLLLLFHCADQHALHLVFVHAPLGWLLFWGYRWIATRLAHRALPLTRP